MVDYKTSKRATKIDDAASSIQLGFYARSIGDSTGEEVIGAEMNGGSMANGTQAIKIPQLRNLHEKSGFDRTSTSNNRGFGFLHDGNTDTLFNFLGVFPFDDQKRLDVEAFLLCFSTDTHAGVGAQATLPQPEPAGQPPSVSELIGLAAAGDVGLVVKGVVDDAQRGYYRAGDGTFQSDRASEVLDETTLLALAGPGAELTFTAVPPGSEVRIGVDRDEDGFLDRDELDAGSNPADPVSTPANVGDLNGDGVVGRTDFLALLAAWGPCPQPCPPSCEADFDSDCTVGITDFLTLFSNWG